jgi:Na+/proline symporter
MHAIIKAANPVFGVLIFLCISGFLSGKYQNEWLDTILLVLNSLWLSLLLLKLSKLITFPWFALGSKPNEIKRSKLQVKDGATWLILTSWVIALALTLFLQSCLRFDYQQANITHQLIKQAINFYVPQPFLWFIAVVAREYAVITPRKTWTLRRSLSKN